MHNSAINSCTLVVYAIQEMYAKYSVLITDMNRIVAHLATLYVCVLHYHITLMNEALHVKNCWSESFMNVAFKNSV